MFMGCDEEKTSLKIYEDYNNDIKTLTQNLNIKCTESILKKKKKKALKEFCHIYKYKYKYKYQYWNQRT